MIETMMMPTTSSFQRDIRIKTSIDVRTECISHDTGNLIISGTSAAHSDGARVTRNGHWCN